MYHQFGKVELEDQIAGVNYLKSLPFVDGNRIGIWGWSYGGYMTLDAMLTLPGVFKAGVSVAPVSDWRLYDTIYTERYMGRPQDDRKGTKILLPAITLPPSPGNSCWPTGQVTITFISRILRK